MPSNDITQQDIDLLRDLRAAGDMPNYFWQVPMVRLPLMLVAALAFKIAGDVYIEQAWFFKSLFGLAVLGTGWYVGVSFAKNRRYAQLLVKLLDRHAELRQRL